MTIIEKEILVNANGKKCVAYMGLHKGFSYSVKFDPVRFRWVEPTCCVHCGKDYNLNKSTLRRVLPVPPFIFYLEKDIVFTYQPMFIHYKSLNENTEEHLDLASICCKKIINYLDFLDHPERVYA